MKNLTNTIANIEINNTIIMSENNQEIMREENNTRNNKNSREVYLL